MSLSSPTPDHDTETVSVSSSAPDEVARFTAIAADWWNPEGKFQPLHRFNPFRLDWMRRQLAAHFGRDANAERPFEGLTLLDVGCGGGLLSEPLARMGFAVTGIDAGDRNIGVAKAHLQESGLTIDYRLAGPEDMPPESFDVVLCMEVVEHVPDPAEFLALTARALRPGGMFVGATLNRTLKAYALAVIGAEYVLRWLPRGTHDWKKFMKPSEFAACLRAAGVSVGTMVGLEYMPWQETWRETRSLEVNYLLSGVKR